MVSLEGPQLLRFNILGIGDPAPRGPGLFIYARMTRGQWQALYIGESGNLASRLAFNEIAADALLSGATDIHVLQTAGDAAARRDLTEQLVAVNRPPLNEEERVRLGTILDAPQPRKPTPKGRTQAA